MEASVFGQDVVKDAIKYVKADAVGAKDQVERHVRMGMFDVYRDKAVVVMETERQKTTTINLAGALTRDLTNIAKNNKAENERHQVPIDSVVVDSIHLYDGGTPMVRMVYVFEDVCHGGGGRYLYGATQEMVERTKDRLSVKRQFTSTIGNLGFVIPW